MRPIFCFSVKLKDGQLIHGYTCFSGNKLKNGAVFISAHAKDGVLYFFHALYPPKSILQFFN